MISKIITGVIPRVQAYLKTQPINRAWLFGSYSRGEERADSDVDILVEYDRSNGIVSLFKMGGILMDLCDIFGRKVDLVERNGLKQFARESVEQDKILIYERGN